MVRRAAYQGGYCWGQVMTGGDWGWKRKETGGWEYAGPHSQKQPRPVMNYYTVDVRRGAGGDANASRQPSSALHFATAVDFVPRIY